ncbi:hypothetical protein L7F22_046929 [Adiantum nelumboides]|nr:hypothetical protein [Adiantum nelumboides]
MASENTASPLTCNIDGLECVFKLLDLSDLLQCRLVCKLWHLSLGHIDHIRRTLCCRLPIDDVFWIRCEDEAMHVCPRPADAGPSTPCWKSSFPSSRTRYISECKLAASTHGLLCLQVRCKNATQVLVVCNPISGTHKFLSQLTCIDTVESVGMHYNCVTKKYIILAIGTKDKSSKTYCHENGDAVKKPFFVSHVEVYDSQVGNWEYHSHFITDEGVRRGNIAWWQGQFHITVQKAGGVVHLLAYNMTKKQWIDSQVEGLQKHFYSPVLFTWRDLLVCKFERTLGGTIYFKVNQRARSLPNSVTQCKMVWTPLSFDTVKKASSLHIATHKGYGSDSIQVCLFDPHFFTPNEALFTSQQEDIICCKLWGNVECFSFTPCQSAKI